MLLRLQRRPPRRVAGGLVALAAVLAAAVLLASAGFDVRAAAGGRPLAVADLCIRAGEAACCVLLAWAVWRGPGAAR